MGSIAKQYLRTVVGQGRRNRPRRDGSSLVKARPILTNRGLVRGGEEECWHECQRYREPAKEAVEGGAPVCVENVGCRRQEAPVADLKFGHYTSERKVGAGIGKNQDPASQIEGGAPRPRRRKNAGMNASATRSQLYKQSRRGLECGG